MRDKQQKRVDSGSTANLTKAGLDNTRAESNQQNTIDTCVTTDLVEAELNLGKAKSDAHAKFLCKGTYMLPYEFRAPKKLMSIHKKKI